MIFNNYFIDNFLFEKQVNQWLSIKTIHTYNTSFRVLLNNPYISLEDPNTFTELNFKRLLWEYLIKNNWTSYTYNRYKKNFKIFCQYLVKEKYISENPLKDIRDRKIDKVLPKTLSSKQVEEVIYLVNKLYAWDAFLLKRNRAIVYTYLYTWIRLSELTSLTYLNISLEEWYIKILKWKGWKDRYVPIVNKLSFILQDYIKSRNLQSFQEVTLFPTRYGGSMQHRDIYAIINKIREKINFKLTCHMFRHTFATELARKNLNLYNISQILWHSKIDTTKIYLNFDTETIKNSLNMLNIYS